MKDRNTALITAEIAKKYFGTQDPVGQLLHVDDSLLVRITGVLQDLPPNTDFRSQIYIPFANLQDHSPWMVEKDWWFSVNKEMQCFVRLKPGISAASVNKTILPAISNTHYDKEPAQYFQFRLQPLSDVHFNPELRGKTDKKNLRTFAWIGFFLILTACVNFINLATAQALGRSREIGVRKALGSRRAPAFLAIYHRNGSHSGPGHTIVALGLAYLALPFVNGWFEIDLALNLLTDRYLLSLFIGSAVARGFLFRGLSRTHPRSFSTPVGAERGTRSTVGRRILVAQRAGGRSVCHLSTPHYRHADRY